MLEPPKIIKVLAFHDYLLHIQLSDNRWLELDMKIFLQYPAYRKLENKGYFFSVKYDNNLIYWDDMHDMHIDQILHFSVPITEQEHCVLVEAAHLRSSPGMTTTSILFARQKPLKDFLASAS